MSTLSRSNYIIPPNASASALDLMVLQARVERLTDSVKDVFRQVHRVDTKHDGCREANIEILNNLILRALADVQGIHSWNQDVARRSST
jgi:hypothetical protein